MSVPTWYVAQTAPRLEDRAEAGIRELGLDAYCPRLTRWITRSRRKVAAQAPLFGRYLFVQALDDGDIYRIRRTDGILSILSLDGRPWPVKGVVVEDIRTRETLGHFDKTRKARPMWSPGQPVRLLAGPFAGIEARVLREKPGKRLEILLSLLGGERVAKVDPREVESA